MPEAVAVYAGDPSTASGTVTGPGAGAIITGATLTLGMGRWEVSVEASWGGVANVQDNIQLKVIQGNPAVTKLYPLKMSGAASSVATVNDRLVITVYSGTATVSVNAIGVDATGVYNVNLIARPLLV